MNDFPYPVEVGVPVPRQSTDRPALPVLLADAEPVFLAGLVAVMAGIPGVTVLASARTVTEARQALAAHKAPCLIVCGFVLACGRDVFSIFRELDGLPEGCKLLALVPETAIPFLPRTKNHLPSSILKKSASPDEIRAAVERIFAGHPPSRAIPEGRLPRSGSSAAVAAFARLSDREREILRLIGSNRSQKEIAATLGLSPRTIETHMATLRSKLGASNNRALAHLAASAAIWEETATDYLV